MEEFQLQKALCYLNYNASEDVVGGAQENAITFRRYKSFLKTDFSTKFQKKKKKKLVRFLHSRSCIQVDKTKERIIGEV